MIRHAALAALLVISLAAPAVAQQTVFVVRHAERADAGSAAGTMMASDPELSAAGRARAATLAAMLRDAGISAIFVTEFRRTQQTAEPLARALGLEPSISTAKDVAALLSQIRAARGNVLVVGHSNTVGEVISALGVPGVKVGDGDYDNLFVVTGGALVRLHYGS